MQYATEKDFEHLSSLVGEKFVSRRMLLKQKLKVYELDVFFLSDAERRGRGTIRAYIESFHFDKFSPSQLQTGGKYVSFCDIFKVCTTSYCQYATVVFIFSTKKGRYNCNTVNSK